MTNSTNDWRERLKKLPPEQQSRVKALLKKIILRRLESSDAETRSLLEALQIPREKRRVMALVAKYVDQFSAPVPPDALQNMPDQELLKVLAEALLKNQPVPEWKGASPFDKMREDIPASPTRGTTTQRGDESA